MEKLTIPLEIEHYEKKIYDLKTLIDISKGLNSTLDFNQLIESVLLTMMGQMHSYKVGIFLNNDIEDPNFYLHPNYKGFDVQSNEAIVIESDSELIKFFDENNHCCTLQSILADERFIKSRDALQKISPELIIPLRAKGRVAGLMMMGEKLNSEPYTYEEKDFLLTLASIAAIAVENARLYELATVDMMTRLRIHHYFQTRLKEERERTRRNLNPLCLMFTDIDHFKKFNDTYGHQTGDYVLKEVARILSRTVRVGDIPARYGGEEFAAILPNTNIEEALAIAERVRKNVEDNEVVDGEQSMKVTISIGVTIYDPNEDKSNKDIIEKADKALYLAKKNGRNQVVLYEKPE